MVNLRLVGEEIKQYYTTTKNHYCFWTLKRLLLKRGAITRLGFVILTKVGWYLKWVVIKVLFYHWLSWIVMQLFDKILDFDLSLTFLT